MVSLSTVLQRRLDSYKEAGQNTLVSVDRLEQARDYRENVCQIVSTEKE